MPEDAEPEQQEEIENVHEDEEAVHAQGHVEVEDKDVVHSKKQIVIVQKEDDVNASSMKSIPVQAWPSSEWTMLQAGPHKENPGFF